MPGIFTSTWNTSLHIFLRSFLFLDYLFSTIKTLSGSVQFVLIWFHLTFKINKVQYIMNWAVWIYSIVHSDRIWWRHVHTEFICFWHYTLGSAKRQRFESDQRIHFQTKYLVKNEQKKTVPEYIKSALDSISMHWHGIPLILTGKHP